MNSTDLEGQRQEYLPDIAGVCLGIVMFKIISFIGLPELMR